ncbi:hypothetical protein [Croceicoccus naphthovorans]|uniref:Uncharacterized protein n=1 Tax=Croceicoccus naphthovorans TaxID=1348774 RepID=A0A0G3XFH5_9SPHN|nr:hypothetical protein [Croceicoccus naphthovorans]AKM09369.1 hypothetical protein AB433_04215 [Croceicoccus naphthovorans]MBB3990289.1 hypothetical protein [Croceicoccus naphthovorans]
MIDPTPPVNARYGAPLGRRSHQQGDVLPDDPPLTLLHCPLDEGGYDEGGAYWGLGDPLFWVGNDEGDLAYFLRARGLRHAQRLVREDYPDAHFHTNPEED